ncbi:MAG: IS1595 family transposase [Desulfovibrionaceae bacterium]|jgi:transposase|nr:IS1595 family transposase [Desulfovibrionaceae bacterium]
MHHGNVEHRRLSREALYRTKLLERPLPGEPQAAHDDEAARALLAPWLPGPGSHACPRCAHATVYALSGGRLRCAACRYTFTPLTGRWINSGNLAPSDWVFVARLFVEGATAHQAASMSGLSYNTVFKALTVLRFAVLASALDAPSFFGLETGLRQYLRNGRVRTLPRKTQLETSPVFGLMEQGGWAFVDILPNYQSEIVFHFHLSFHLPVARDGNILHTGPFRHYRTLITCAEAGAPFGVLNTRLRPEIDADSFTFWSYAKKRLKEFKGITPSRFTLYLKEIEFRYNHRDQDLMPLILERLCARVPEMD